MLYEQGNSGIGTSLMSFMLCVADTHSFAYADKHSIAVPLGLHIEWG